MRKFVIASLLGLATGLLAGCPDRTISEVIPEQGRVETKDIPVNFNRNVDILFVIDDSPSMADKQQNLADNFPNFINVLNTIQGGLPDVHIGVASSDMGTFGSNDSAPGPSIGQIGNGGCSGTGKNGNLQTQGAPVTGAFISDIKQMDGSRQTNYTGNLSDVFKQMATGAGAGGCGFEQHLAAAKHALNNNPANAGFVRQDAFLALIFIADEDDCSLQHSNLLSASDQSLGPLQSFRCTRFGVTCDNGGVSELVEDSGCGIVVRANADPDVARGLADAFMALAADPARRAAYGSSGAASARARYSPAAMARATAAVYRGDPRA